MAYSPPATDGLPADGGGGGLSTMGGLGALLSLFGTGMKSFAQVQEGQSRKKLAEYNARIEEHNASVADFNQAVAGYQATDALERGTVAETRKRTDTQRVIGSQRAALAAQGVDINQGSAVDVQADAAYLGELDALTLRNNAAREAWGYRLNIVQAGEQATGSRMRAQAALYGGQVAEQTANMGAATTILGGTSDLLLAKYGFSRSPFSTNPIR